MMPRLIADGVFLIINVLVLAGLFDQRSDMSVPPPFSLEARSRLAYLNRLLSVVVVVFLASTVADLMGRGWYIFGAISIYALSSTLLGVGSYAVVRLATRGRIFGQG